jgi:syntaxin-binding protein 1
VVQCGIQEHIFGSVPRDKWYAFVVDEVCLRVLSTHMKVSELLDYNVSVVEPLAQARKDASDGIYFITPTRRSVQRLCADFTGRKPIYQNAYVFFSSKASDSVKNLIKGCPALVDRLRALKEV